MRCMWLLTYNRPTNTRQDSIAHFNDRHDPNQTADTSVKYSHERKKLKEEEVATREARTEADLCLL